MKLHLPLRLRKALLACFAFCSIASTQAADYSGSFSWTSTDPTFTFSDSTAPFSVSLSTDKAYKPTNVNSGTFTPDSNVGSGNPWTLTFTVTNNSGADYYLTPDSFSVFLFNSGGNAHGTNTTRNIDLILSGSFNGEVEKSPNEASATTPEVYDFDVPYVLIRQGDSVSFDLTAEKHDPTAGTFVGLTAASFESVPIYYWEGGLAGEWSGTSWSAVNGNNSNLTVLDTASASLPIHVVFDNEETAKVGISGGARATIMEISKGDYTFEGTGSLTISDMLKVSGTATFSTDVVFDAGAIVTVDSGTVTFGKGLTFRGLVGTESTEPDSTQYTLFNVLNDGRANVDAATSDALKQLIDIDGVLEIGNEWSYANGILTITNIAKDLVWHTDGSTENIWQDGDTLNWGTGITFINEDNAIFNGEGESITVYGDVIATSATVTGTNWEWAGDGSLTVGELTVGDGTAASTLTISATRSKNFINGITVKENATLVVKNLDSWTGKVSGAGTLELSGVATQSAGNAYAILSTVIDAPAGGATLGALVLSDGTVLDAAEADKDNLQNIFSNIGVIKVANGACLAMQTELNAPELHLAGAGVTTSEQWTPAALSIRSDMTLYCDIELDDNATIRTEESVTGTLDGNIAFNGKQLTKIGSGILDISKLIENDIDLNIEEGTVHLGNRFNSSKDTITATGTVTLKNSACLSSFGPELTITTLTVENGGILQVGRTESIITEIQSVTGNGTITLTRDTNARGSIHEFELSGSNTFSGDWVLDRHVALKITHTEALANATVSLDFVQEDNAANKATLKLHCETVRLKGLKGSNGKISLSGPTNHYLVINTDAEKSYEYSGDFGDGLGYLNLVKDGAGTQSFTGDLNAFNGDITVNAGRLNLGTAQTIVEDRSVSIAAGATLGAALELNGGALSLDATGTAASLGGNALSFGTEKTALTLSLLDTASSSTPITLLQGIKEGLTLEEGATLATYFTLAKDAYSIISSIGVQLLGEGTELRTDITVERLLGSALSVEDGKLLLTLLPAELVNDPLYWDPTADDGDGNWLGANWSAEDALGVDPGTMQNPWQGDKPVSVVFDGDVIDGNAKVTIDTDAVVTDMTVQNGEFTFVKDGNTGSLTIKGELTVDSGAKADISALGSVSVGSLDIAGADTTTDPAKAAGELTADNLVVTGDAAVKGSLDATSLSAAKITITGDTASVEAGTITVGEDNLSMDGGTLAVDTLTGDGKAEITGGTLTIGSTELSSTTVTGAEFVGTSKLEGDADSTVAVGGVTVGNGDTATPDTLNLSNATLTGIVTVMDDGTVTFGGEMVIDNTKLTAVVKDEFSNNGNGFITTNREYTILADADAATDGYQAPEGVSEASTGVQWSVGLGEDKKTGTYQGGIVSVKESQNTTSYWVNAGKDDVMNSVAEPLFEEDDPTTGVDETTRSYTLNGGTLVLDTALADNIDIKTNNTDNTEEQKASGIKIQEDITLDDDQLKIADGTTVTLSGDGIYAISGKSLRSGVYLGSDDASTPDKIEGWTGIVQVGDVSDTFNKADLSSLGNENSTVKANSIKAAGLTVGSVRMVIVQQDADLTGANGISESEVNTMEVGGKLIIGRTNVHQLTANTLDAAGITVGEGATVNVTDKLTVGAGGIDYDSIKDTVSADSLALADGVSSLNITLVGSQIQEAADMAEDTTAPLATLMEVGEDASDIALTLKGVTTEKGSKYGYTLTWNTGDDNTYLLQLTATANENYMKEKFSGGSANGMAGATLMDEAFANGGVGDGELEAIMNAVDAENSGMTDEHMAAIAGSSTAALGMAFAGDVERQLRAIRNRTTTMGVNQCVVNEGMPYFNAWVNAEGNMGELDKDGTYAGYKLDNWGGTVGFDVDVNPNLTLGLAVTAMYGDLTVDGPDMLDGDMDTYYVTAFARYSKRAWTHTFIGTVGKMDGSYERTVNHAGGSYTAEGDTDGLAFGLMYEVGRVYALTEDGDTCLQPVFNVAYRHTTVNGYTEKGGNAALDVDDQTLDTITLGAGARMQAVVGENLYNRTSVLELRALAKLDVGDRASEADVAFIGGGSRATVESAELGAFGVELGAGLSIPVGDENDGTLFFDVSAEFRSGYSELNGTVGYRINF